MIKSHPDAPLGAVSNWGQYLPGDFPTSCAILCRNNAPLVRMALGLIKRNVGCKILGRDFGDSLIALVKKMKCDTTSELRDNLRIYREKQEKEAHRELSTLRDRIEAIEVLAEDCDSVDEIGRKITKLFSEDAGELVTLSSIHKAKGLEWELVYILDKFLLPSKYARQPWQLLQERNLEYVAVTRAKLELRYIESNRWKQNNGN